MLGAVRAKGQAARRKLPEEVVQELHARYLAGETLRELTAGTALATPSSLLGRFQRAGLPLRNKKPDGTIEVLGHLTLQEGTNAPALTRVEGNLTLEEGAGANAVVHVGGDLYVSKGASASAVKSVGGNLTLEEGANASAVESVGSSLVRDEGADVPILKSVGGFYLVVK